MPKDICIGRGPQTTCQVPRARLYKGTSGLIKSQNQSRKRFFKSQVELRAKAKAAAEGGKEEETEQVDTFDILPETNQISVQVKLKL